MQEPRLHAGIALDPQRIIVLPGNVKPRRHTHNRRGSIRLALIPRGFVGRWVPPIRDLPGLFRHGYGLVIAFAGCDHPETPVLSHESDPITCHIHGSGDLCRTCNPGSPGAVLAGRARLCDERHNECRDEEDFHCTFSLRLRYTASTKSLVVQEPVSEP